MTRGIGHGQGTRKRADISNWTPVNLAWAAGLFEGEGCFGSTVKYPDTYRYRRVYANVTGTDQDTIEKFAEIVGFGAVSTRPLPSGKTMYRWATYSFEKAQAVMAAFWPHLSERRRGTCRRLLAEVHADIAAQLA